MRGCKGRPFSECVDKIVGKKDGKQKVRGEKIFVQMCECVPVNLGKFQTNWSILARVITDLLGVS